MSDWFVVGGWVGFFPSSSLLLPSPTSLHPPTHLHLHLPNSPLLLPPNKKHFSYVHKAEKEKNKNSMFWSKGRPYTVGMFCVVFHFFVFLFFGPSSGQFKSKNLFWGVFLLFLLQFTLSFSFLASCF